MGKSIKIEFSDLGAIAVKSYKILEVANGFLTVEDNESIEKRIPFATIKKVGIET
jgi:CRISPR/Cas system-associated endonuclease Cas1